MNAQPLRTQQYANIGMRLVNADPSYAYELLAVKDPEPTKTDLSLIQSYFKKFSDIYGVPIKSKDRYDFRVLFIACIIQLYQPRVFITKIDQRTIRSGIIIALSDVLKIDKSGTSRWVRQSIASYKIYQEFTEQVLKVLEGWK